MKASAKITNPGAVSHPLETFNATVERGLMAMGEHWHYHIHSGHYLNAATLKYGYTPRHGERGDDYKRFKNSYTGKKKRLRRHSKPLVWFGTSRDQALGGSVKAIVNKTSNQRVEITVPNVFNFPPRADQAKIKSQLRTMLAEIQATTSGEMITLDHVFDSKVHQAYPEESRRRSKTVNVVS